MLLLSADDYLLPGALRRAADLMDAYPEVGFTFGNAVELSDSGNETPIKSIIDVTNDSDKRILAGRELIELSGADNLVATCSAVVRTELQKAGGYQNCRIPATWKCGCALPPMPRLALFPHIRAFTGSIEPTCQRHTILFRMVV
jgi:hypothetical protein